MRKILSLSQSDISVDRRDTVGTPSGFNAKSLLKRLSVAALFLFAFMGNVWGADVTATYTVNTVNTVTVTGTAPTGSSASVSTTGAINSGRVQLAGNNGEKNYILTLSGYDGKIIKGLKVKLGSNKSSGNAALTFKAGETTLATIASANLNDESWFGSWVSSGSEKNVTLTSTSYVVGEDENLVVTIKNTANSAYVYYVSIVYETPVPSLTLNKSALNFGDDVVKGASVDAQTFTITGANLTADVTLSLDAEIEDAYTLSKSSLTKDEAAAGATITVTPVTTAAGEFNGNLTIASTGAESQTVALSMTVLETYSIETKDVDGHGLFSWTVNSTEGVTPVIAGTSVLAIYEADDNYVLDQFDIYKKGDATTKVENTNGLFSMPAYDVVISGSFRLATAPSVEASVASLPLGELNINSTPADGAKTFTITGENLTADVTLALDNEGGEAFTLSETEFTKEAVMANGGVTVTVTPTTGTAGSFTNTITIASEGATSQTVALSLTVNKLAAGLAWNAEEATAKIDSVNELPTLANPNELTVAYSSSNTDVAEINASGVITLKAAGTTVITAASDETATYLAGSDTYTLTVEKYYTVTWKVNGETVKTQNAQAEGAISAPDLSETTLAGKTFRGWVAKKIDGTDNNPELITPSIMPAKDVEYYAAFASAGAGKEAVETEIKYSGKTSNMTGNGNEAATFGLSTSEWNVVADKGSASNNVGLNNAGDIRLYYNAEGSNTLTITSLTTTIDSLKLTFTDDSYSNVSVTVNNETVSATDGVYTINANSFVLGNANTSNFQVRISNIEVYTAREVTVYSAYATTQYAVNFEDPENGTLDVMNGEDAITSGDKFWSGTELTVEAKPTVANYKLVTLTANGENIISTKKFTIGTAPVVVVAEFAIATALDNTAVEAKAVKSLQNGMLIIEKGGKKFNAQGQLIK